ncbi:unnamed protein product [Rhodiola kirilowii]
MRYFYLGMSKEAKGQMDTASGGAIMDLPANQGFKVIEKIATNSDRYQGVDHKKMAKSREDSSNYVTKDQFGDLAKKMETMISMVNALEVSKSRNEKEKNPVLQPCFLCSSTKHSTRACPDGKYEDDGYEEAHYVNQQRSYAQNSGPITRNYEPPQRRMANDSNFPPKPQGQNNYQGNYQRPYQAKPPMNDQGTSNQQRQAPSNTQDNAMMSMMVQMLEGQKESNKIMEMLENQVAQQAVALKQFGKLPSQPDVNSIEHCNAIFLKGEESSITHVDAITLKSGRVLPNPQTEPSPSDKEVELEIAHESPEIELQVPAEKEKEKEEPVLMRKYVPMVPFPQRLNKSKLDAHFQRFVEMLKKLYVTLPFHEVITQNPTYTKFLKDIVSGRRVIEESSMVALNHECSDLFSEQIPLKMKDPGRFTIPCSIGAVSFEHPLADLGASVSVMPLATYYKLGLEGMRATKMVMQLADGTKRQPKGVIENVPVKVDKFYIPCDFVVMDMGNSGSNSLILGRPFLATAGFKVDLGKGKLTLKIGGEKIKIERPTSDQTSEQVATQEPCELKEQESARAENVEVKKVTKKDLYKLIDPDEDPPLDHYRMPSCNDGVKRKANAKTVKSEKQASLWTRAIKQVACNSPKNPD